VLRTFFALAAVMLVLPATALAGPTRAESALLHELNRARAAHGLEPLAFDPRLERAAHAHTSDMLRSNVFAHGAFASRMLQFRVGGSTAGENLAWGAGAQGSARVLVTGWLASPAHREILLGPSFRRVGVGERVGRFQGFAGAHVVTADFAG
jgi:uncharacterized protein YkwD